MLRLKKYLLSLILLPIFHLVLLELFVSAHYLLYFLTLLIILYFLNSERFYLSSKMSLFSLIYMTGLYFIIKLFEDSLYDLYIDMDMTFNLSYISYEVCCILSLLHILILFLLGYNRAKLI